jgi:hypothetical protein
MSTADFGSLPGSAVIGKAEVKDSVDKGAENKEKKQRCDSLQHRPSNTAQPCLAGVLEEDIETGGPAQSLGQGSRFQRLPEGLEEVIGSRVFVNEDDLEAALEELKTSDEPIVLGDDRKAYYYMPGDVHNTATSHIAKKFYSWSHDMKGYAQENTNVKLGPRLAGAPPPRKRLKPKKRLPDVALWGRSKCELDDNGKISKPLRVSPANPHPVVHPHVVIQISIFNDEDYEVDAINDLVTRAVAGQGTPPNLGLLIKQREAAPGVQAGFDIYYLPAGTFLGDTLNGTNGARHVVYNHGGPDVLVTITEQDLGGIKLTLWQSIKDFLLGGNKDFELSMAQLYGLLF